MARSSSLRWLASCIHFGSLWLEPAVARRRRKVAVTVRAGDEAFQVVEVRLVVRPQQPASAARLGQPQRLPEQAVACVLAEGPRAQRAALEFCLARVAAVCARQAQRPVAVVASSLSERPPFATWTHDEYVVRDARCLGVGHRPQRTQRALWFAISALRSR